MKSFIYNKFFIPFDNFKDIGGPATFMANLRQYLGLRQFHYTTKFWRVKNIFFPISYDLEILKKIKKRGGKIIQRLDGIYYPSKHGDKYSEMNAAIKDIYLNYANFVVFQSEYSKQQCFAMFGEKSPENYTIIVNGVDEKMFFPSETEWPAGEKLRLVTTGNFRNLDMIEPVIKALDLLVGQVDFELVVVGKFATEDLKKLIQRDYVNYLGSKKLTEVAEILRACHLFVYSHLNPPCPNSVVEAIATGLPVVGFDSGAMTELCHYAKELLAPVSEDIFQKYEDFKPELLAEKIKFTSENYLKYRQLALDNSRLYLMAECGKKYVEVFDRFVK